MLERDVRRVASTLPSPVGRPIRIWLKVRTPACLGRPKAARGLTRLRTAQGQPTLQVRRGERWSDVLAEGWGHCQPAEGWRHFQPAERTARTQAEPRLARGGPVVWREPAQSHLSVEGAVYELGV